MFALRGEKYALPRRIRLILTAAAVALVLFIFRAAFSQLLLQVLLAVLLAWSARPLCALLERRLPAGLSAFLSLISFLLALSLLLGLLLPQLIKQGAQAVGAVPYLLELMQQVIDHISQSSLAQQFDLSFASSQELLQKAASALLGAAPRAMQKIAATGSSLMRMFLSPVLAFYFLRDRESFCFQLSLVIPIRLRRRILTALREMRREIAGYFRGQLLVSLAVALLTALALLLVGVPAWLLLGIVMGICDLIPYAGPYLGAIPILLFSIPQGLYTVIWAAIAIVVVQQAESMFLSPHLMSGATGLHPAYVLLLLSAGGLIGGLLGMLLSLPLFVCIRGAVRALQCAAKS